MIIARHFNAGKSHNRISPEGTVERGALGGEFDSTTTPLSLTFQPSLRDSRDRHFGPRVKTRGFYQVSLQDKSGQRFGEPRRTTAVDWKREHFGRSLARRILSCAQFTRLRPLVGGTDAGENRTSGSVDWRSTERKNGNGMSLTW